MSEEIDAFVEKYGRLPYYTEREELPVVVAVLKETIRYRSSAYLGIPHKATEDSKLKIINFFLTNFFSYSCLQRLCDS